MSSEPLVDVHVHLYPDKDAGRTAKDRYVIWEYGDDPGITFSPVAGDLEDLARSYGSGGFDRAVVVHLFDTDLAREEALAALGAASGARPGPPPPGATAAVDEAVGDALRESNRWVAGVAETEPSIEVLVSVDPNVLAPDAMVAHLGELADRGVRGVKLHPVSQGYLPDDARLDAIYQTCSDAGLVVLSHSGPGHHGGASARPSQFAPVLERWPELTMVLAHLGGASWHETRELAERFPQVVFDLSEIIEWSEASSAPTPEELSGLIRSIGAGRVMLGSDFPWYDPAGTADRVMALPGLGSAERAAVLGGTAVGVFGLDRDRSAR